MKKLRFAPVFFFSLSSLCFIPKMAFPATSTIDHCDVFELEEPEPENACTSEVVLYDEETGEEFFYDNIGDYYVDDCRDSLEADGKYYSYSGCEAHPDDPTMKCRCCCWKSSLPLPDAVRNELPPGDAK